MGKSLFSRLSGKSKKSSDDVPTVDLSRVTGSKPSKPSTPPPAAAPVDVDAETIDVKVWMTADLNRLSTTWNVLVEMPEDKDAHSAFSQSIHNLHGASGAYGGGALTRLTGALQKLASPKNDLEENAALINLLVQACRAAAIDSDASEEIANTVCDTLEAQVEKALNA